MAVNTYECMLLFDANRVSGDLPGAVAQIHAVFERHGAEVLASRQWDERRLAYPIKGHKKGLYYLTYIRTDGKALANVEHDFALNENILRMLVLRIDPKLVDTMLALARDEHAMALQSLPDEPLEEALAGRGGGRRDGGRRRD